MSTVTARQSPARHRIVDTALELFYAEGIRAVGIDRIIAEAGVAKATFYHHFPTKDELVRAYLEEQARLQRAGLAELTGDGPREPAELVLAIFDVIGEIGCGPAFRGCPFINAAAEYPDPGHPVRREIAAHRRWFRDKFADLLTRAGASDAGRTADMLLMLRDGIAVSSNLDDPQAVRAVVRETVARLLGPVAFAAR
jgi:AcrR family transcriptional regulator